MGLWNKHTADPCQVWKQTSCLYCVFSLPLHLCTSPNIHSRVLVYNGKKKSDITNQAPCPMTWITVFTRAGGGFSTYLYTIQGILGDVESCSTSSNNDFLNSPSHIDEILVKQSNAVVSASAVSWLIRLLVPDTFLFCQQWGDKLLWCIIVTNGYFWFALH